MNITDRVVQVRVPGTSANCGAGFDCIGVACSIYNELSLRLLTEDRLDIEIEGEGADSIPRDQRNIVWRAVKCLLRWSGNEKNVHGAEIYMKNAVPISSGLGSSAAAIVSGLTASNILLGNPYTKWNLLQTAVSIEGHPDNVAPAIYGGFTVSIVTDTGKTQSIGFMPHMNLKMVVVMPDRMLSTRKAREVLPDDVPRRDAIYNVSRAAFLVAALCKGQRNFIKYAVGDKLHQQYREKLLPEMRTVIEEAEKHGAMGAFLSGAGPCIMALTSRNTDEIGKAMADVFHRNGTDARYRVLDIDRNGACEIK
ncbi:MAG: homoserine kinase [Veillonellaceae bacterium]|nr:homoserine kinase [Veillonellaceae bacterium]MDD6923699.1 homoserine kinase [Veillonellaceae bacterium]